MTTLQADRVGALADLVRGGGVVVLSGAGLSTESGIPDYRGPSGSLRRHTPTTYQEFHGRAAVRRRYWARSQVGWRHVAAARPNAGHRAVGELERRGLLAGIITQNVDGLHQAGGARRVLELHGSLSRVLCLDCGDRSLRVALDRRLRAANPHVGAVATALNPDGDVELAEDALDAYQVVGCVACGGTLKPDVVFFGEAVPRDRVATCFTLVDHASALLVLGSSLAVMSGYRFVVRAAERGVPVAIVNQGATRGDPHATLKLDAPLGEVLPALVTGLSRSPHMSDLATGVSPSPHMSDLATGVSPSPHMSDLATGVSPSPHMSDLATGVSPSPH